VTAGVGSGLTRARASLRRLPFLSRLMTRGSENGRAYLLLAPTVFWLGLFLLVPLVLVAITSLTVRGAYGETVYRWTLANYARFFEPLYVQILWRSLVVAFWTTAICLAVGYPFAYFLAQVPRRHRGTLLMLVIVPFWTNFLIRTYAWVVILRTTGVINTVLQALGLISEPLSLLYTPGAVLVGMVYGFLPFMVLPLYTSIEKLDHSLLEASSDLGAPPWRTFLRVTLPMTMPGVVAGTILVFIPALGMFVVPDLLGGARTMLIGNLIQNQFLTARNWQFGSAASIILMALVTVGLMAYARSFGFEGEELVG